MCGLKKKASIEQLGNHLYLISLPTNLSGFEGFITTWLYTGGPVALVDTGPAASAACLLDTLADMGVRHLDVILLTHIHIDHAGGAGIIAKAYADTPVVCHAKGIPHLVDPERLWQGSLKTLGDVARAYGPIEPVTGRQLVPAGESDHGGITAIETLGHSAHHFSYLIDDILFAGEAGGVCLTLPGNGYYLRPATPPRFFLETYVQSIENLCGLQASVLCYGHVGMRRDPATMLKQHRDQLLRWVDMIRPFHDRTQDDDPEKAAGACRQYLLANDPLLSGFVNLSKTQQARESGFLLNSIKGYWGYLSS